MHLHMHMLPHNDINTVGMLEIRNYSKVQTIIMAGIIIFCSLMIYTLQLFTIKQIIVFILIALPFVVFYKNAEFAIRNIFALLGVIWNVQCFEIKILLVKVDFLVLIFFIFNFFKMQLQARGL